jgi:hypothetical protein
MARRAMLVAAALALSLLLALPGLAWYKPAAGPRHYSVGRAAGLLSGFRKPPSARTQRYSRASPELRPSSLQNPVSARAGGRRAAGGGDRCAASGI